MKRARVAGLLLGMFLLAGFVPAQGDDSFRVIVNESNPTVSLSRTKLPQLFLRKVREWDLGRRVVAVDQVESAPVRQEFSRHIHAKALLQTRATGSARSSRAGRYRQPEESSDRAVLDFVKSNPAAIG